MLRPHFPALPADIDKRAQIAYKLGSRDALHCGRLSGLRDASLPEFDHSTHRFGHRFCREPNAADGRWVRGIVLVAHSSPGRGFISQEPETGVFGRFRPKQIT